ncbi:MAG: HAD family hydrolase [Lachnotalea sp.]
MLKMVCFDLDGTIADTIPMCIEVFRKAISPYAGHTLSDYEIIRTFGMNEKGMVKSIVGDMWQPALKDFYICYERMLDMCTEPFQGIRELLEELTKRNVLITMVTGKGLETCKITMNKLQLNHYFCEYITGSDKGNCKAEGMMYLLEKYNLRSDEFIYIGDAISDIIACENANVLCFSAAWAKSADLKALHAANSDLVFTNVSDLSKLIKDRIA